MVANYKIIRGFEASAEWPINLTDAGSLLYFTHSSFAVENTLWRTDTTGENTLNLLESGEDEAVNSINLEFSAVKNEKLFFSASNQTTGLEPWISDGTPEGTKILKDINPDGASNPQDFYPLGDTVIFTANDGSTDEDKLWTSDGTTEGTQAIELEAADATELYPVNFADRDLEGSLYFSTQGEGNASLWRTDGTQAGTQEVFDLAANELTSEIDNITAVGDRLFFTSGTPDTPDALWTSDGTADGTNSVIDGLVFNNAEQAGEFVDAGDTLLFAADNGTTGRELWKSDDTAEGTTLVKDIFPGGESSNIQQLTDVNGVTFFVANNGANGAELWKSDGTPEGTTLVKDIAIGKESSSIADLTVVDGTLYFTNGGELWTSDGTEGGTFKVESPRFNFNFAPTGSLENVDRVQDLVEFNDTLYFTADTRFNSSRSIQALLSLSDINDPAGSPVYRLFNPELGLHFYTIEEDDSVSDSEFSNSGYQLEGSSFTAVLPNAEGSEEVYRFFNETTGGYLYTTNEAERDSIQANMSDLTFQGIAFNAYETQIEDSIPIYRFFERTTGVHFYTSDEVERESIEANLPNYSFEGIAYYALPGNAAFEPLI